MSIKDGFEFEMWLFSFKSKRVTLKGTSIFNEKEGKEYWKQGESHIIDNQIIVIKIDVGKYRYWEKISKYNFLNVFLNLVVMPKYKFIKYACIIKQ